MDTSKMKSAFHFSLPFERKTLYVLGLIFFAAIFLRVTPLIYLEWRHPGWDAENMGQLEFYYDDVARSLIVGKGFVHSANPRFPSQTLKPGTPFHFVPPLYAWWLYLVYLVFGPNIFIAKILQSVLDAAVCLVLYLLGKRLFDRDKIALLGAGLYAVYPLAVAMCTRVYYQIPMNILLCCLVLCFMGPVTFKKGIWTGIVVGASALTKPVTLPLIAMMPMIRIGESLKSREVLKASIVWSIGFVAAAVITLAPWTVRNYLVFHKFVPVQNGGDAAFIQGSKEEYIDMDVDSLRKKYGYYFGLKSDEFMKEAINNHLILLRSDPLNYLRFLAKKFLLAWYNTEGKDKNVSALLVQIPFLAFALIGLGLSLKFWLKSPHWYVPGLVLYICAIEVAIFPLVRYTLAVMPLVMIISASGVMALLKKKELESQVN